MGCRIEVNRYSLSDAVVRTCEWVGVVVHENVLDDVHGWRPSRVASRA